MSVSALIHSFFCLMLISCQPQKQLVMQQTIQAEDIIRAIQKGKHIQYHQCIIVGDIDLCEADIRHQLAPNHDVIKINSHMYFEECTFKGRIIGYQSDGNSSTTLVFAEPVIFEQCSFEQPIEFSNALFSYDLTWHKCWIGHHLKLQNADVRGSLIFNDSDLAGELSLQGINVRGHLYMKNVNIGGHFSLQNADIWSSAVLTASTFEQYFDLSMARFRASSYFEYSEFLNRHSFSGSVFMAYTDWHKCHFIHQPDLSRAQFLFTPVWDDIKIDNNKGPAPHGYIEIHPNKPLK